MNYVASGPRTVGEGARGCGIERFADLGQPSRMPALAAQVMPAVVASDALEPNHDLDLGRPSILGAEVVEVDRLRQVVDVAQLDAPSGDVAAELTLGALDDGEERVGHP